MATIKSELDYIQEARSQLAEALITKFGVRRYDNAKDNPTLKGLWTVKEDGSADKLKRLYKANLQNKYAAKKLNKLLKVQGDFKIVKGRIKGQPAKLNISQIRYYQKVFKSFLESPVSYPLGINQARMKSRKALKETLNDIIDDRVITDEDVDDFYDFVESDEYSYFAEKIGPSELYVLINEAQSKNWTEEYFINTICNYANLNSDEARKKAKRLYEKYVA